MTTSTFSREAVEYADSVEPRMILVDGQALAEPMIDHGVGVSVEQRGPGLLRPRRGHRHEFRYRRTPTLQSYRLMRDPMESKEWVFGAAFFSDHFQDQDDEMRTYEAAHKAANALKSETKLLALTTDAPGCDEAGMQ